jgi:hypothetical protein
MGKIVLTDVSVTLGGTAIGGSIASVSLSTTAEEIETTAFGSSARTRVGGLKDNSVQLDFHQQYGAPLDIDSMFYSLVGGTAQMVIKPAGTAAASSANPSFTFNILCTEWQPVNGAVGELATASVTFPIDGDVTRSPA